jgi:hypothetical protein
VLQCADRRVRTFARAEQGRADESDRSNPTGALRSGLFLLRYGRDEPALRTHARIQDLQRTFPESRHFSADSALGLQVCVRARVCPHA